MGTEGGRLIFLIRREVSEVPLVHLVAVGFAEQQLPPCRCAEEHEGEQQLGGPHLFADAVG